MERCSTSSIIRKNTNKSTVAHLSNHQKHKKPKDTNIGKDAGPQQSSHIASGIVDWYNHLEKQNSHL